MKKNKNIAVVGGGPFGILSALRLSQDPSNQITIFESSDKLGGLSMSERYKNQYLDYTTKFIPCNQFGRPGIPKILECLLSDTGALLDDIGDYHFLKNGKDQFLPPVLQGFSKLVLLKEALTIFRYFPKIDSYIDFTELESIEGFQRDKTMEELADLLGFRSFYRLVEYFSMIFGNSTQGMDALSVATSRNIYTTYNYLSKLFLENKVLSMATSVIDKNNLLNKGSKVPYPFVMLTTGYDNFFQSLLNKRDNIRVQLKQTIIDIDDSMIEDNPVYSLINLSCDVFDNFDEIVLALPIKNIQRIKYTYIKNLVKDINTEAHNYVLSTFANIESSNLKHLKKGIYLDHNNPHNIGTSKAKKDGSLYGVFKQFNSDTMFQALTMVNDIDRGTIDESFVHSKWHQCAKELNFGVSTSAIKPYGWKVLRWNTPFVKQGDFGHFENIKKEQGKRGIWFGGEIMSGPGVPVILRFVESLFGAFDLNELTSRKR